MYTPQQIQQASEVPIVQYLASKGIQPVKEISGQYLYYSPFREERTPSFYVEPTKNVFYDFGDDNGDVIRLVRRMDNLSFPDAMRFLLGFTYTGGVEPSGTLKPRNPQKKHVIQKITEVRSIKLKAYLNERKIPLKLANKYIRELHYQTDSGCFYSLAFQNNLGGWELRNKNFKGCLGAKSYTLIERSPSSTIYIFEGFFSFLSFLVYAPNCEGNFIILNSLSMLNKDLLIGISHKRYDHVISYIDNDESGKKANSFIKSHFEMRGAVRFTPAFADVFKEFKDMNDYLVRAHK